MFNPVAVESFPEGEVARDIGAHVLPRGEGGHVVVVLYHTYYNRKFRAVIVRTRKVILVYGMVTSLPTFSDEDPPMSELTVTSPSFGQV